MKVEITKAGYRKLTPAEGYTLTQKGNEDPEKAILSKEISLAVNADEKDWIEITDAKADEIREICLQKAMERDPELRERLKK